MSVFNIPDGKMKLIARGLEPDMDETLIGKLCRVVSRSSALTGEISNIPTGALMPRDENQELGRHEDAKPSDMKLGEIAFKAAHNAGYRTIQDEDLFKGDALDIDLVQETAEGCQRDGFYLQLRAMVDLITNNSKVQNQSIGTKFTDSASDMWGTIDDMFDKVPGADTMVWGRSAAKAGRKHPQAVDRIGSQSKARLKSSEFEDLLVGQFEDEGLEQVHVFGPKTLYNANAQGQSVSVDYLMDDYIALYDSDDLVYVDPQHRLNKRLARWRNEEGSETGMKYDVRGAFVACNSDRHVYGNAV